MKTHGNLNLPKYLSNFVVFTVLLGCTAVFCATLTMYFQRLGSRAWSQSLAKQFCITPTTSDSLKLGQLPHKGLPDVSGGKSCVHPQVVAFGGRVVLQAELFRCSVPHLQMSWSVWGLCQQSYLGWKEFRNTPRSRTPSDLQGGGCGKQGHKPGTAVPCHLGWGVWVPSLLSEEIFYLFVCFRYILDILGAGSYWYLWTPFLQKYFEDMECTKQKQKKNKIMLRYKTVAAPSTVQTHFCFKWVLVLFLCNYY